MIVSANDRPVCASILISSVWNKAIILNQLLHFSGNNAIYIVFSRTKDMLTGTSYKLFLF